ncbi:MAG: cysteine--tRNA ligase [Dehalococcoidia bacterium]|jgi:cysteinyl-tRNA synthetase|nr:cysteine--tRNA ligase [Dehalococcoidia bacterium]
MKLHNTLSAQKEEFLPGGSVVGMYVCGVTPYSDSHLGHAMSYILFDVLRRYLEYRGYKVRHVQNFTDIDDKIITRANTLGISIRELADKYIASYFEVMDALNIRRAHIYPKATEEMPHIIAIVQGLVNKGFAYESEGDVYFRVRRFPTYGRLSKRSVDDMSPFAEEGAKEDALDFTLWKGAKPMEPSWESPWGPGRPGWHIECSAMSLNYIGETLDIHGGGQDLVFPHHENEIAQSECFTGALFVRYWLHNGMLQMGQEKMSKSLGNLLTVPEVLDRYSADAMRIFVLGSHYRSPLTYSLDALEAARRGAERLVGAARGGARVGRGRGVPGDPFRQRFMNAMDDDFNTPQALAVLFDLARDINRTRDEGQDTEEGRGTLLELSGVMGLTLEEGRPSLPAEPFIEALVHLRQDLRESKQFSLADQIRSRLTDIGVALEDTPQGTEWRYRRQ